MKRRAVSEVVAAVILLFIAVVVGTGLYLWYYAYSVRTSQRMLEEVVEEEIRARQVVDVMLAYVDTSTSPDTLVLLIATGPAPVHLVAVYVNGSHVAELDMTLHANVVRELDVSLPTTLSFQPGRVAMVRVIYDGGEVEALAEVV